MKHQLQLFQERQVRSVWDEETEEWYFSVQDVVEILTDSKDVKQYIKRILSRDEQLKNNWGTICTLVEMTAADGKKRKIQAATIEGLFRIIQSIPSPKAEPFKLWIAEVAAQRLDQMQDPELSIDQAMTDYKRLGYSDNWINQRLKSIEIRKDLTDEWKKHGLQEGIEFGTLTDIIYKTWSDKTAKEYKQFKGLKKENLRDNMTNKELVLNMLAELSTKEISESTSPETFSDHTDVAKRGGNIAKEARLKLEEETGKKVVSPLNVKSIHSITQKNDSAKDLLFNIDKIHTTELGVERIKKNLSLETDDVVSWCKQKIQRADKIIRSGKNWYAYIDNIIITINANSYTIITAHKNKQDNPEDINPQ